MSRLNDLIPDDLELLRIALGENRLAAARYTLSGREGHFYCLIEGDASESLSMADVERTLQSLLDHSEDPSTYAYEVLDDIMGVVWTNGLEENDPTTFAKHEFTPINDDYSLDGTMTLSELFSAEDLNAACRLTDRQRENVQVAFDRTDAKDFLAAARLVGSHDLERWHAFEVCEAVSAGVPMDFAADIASPELTFKQARGLRYLAHTIVNSHMQYDERVRGLFHRVAARTDFAEDKIHAVGSVLKATPRLEFEDQWLDLSTDQLRSVRLAQVENVPPSVLHRYSNGEYPAENMDILTLAARDGEIKGQQLDKLLNPALSLGQLVESWAAAIDCGRGKLSVSAFDLICDPQLPQPVMNALRIGLTYHDMPYGVAATVMPSTAPEQVWDLIAQGHDQMPDVSAQSKWTFTQPFDTGLAAIQKVGEHEYQVVMAFDMAGDFGSPDGTWAVVHDNVDLDAVPQDYTHDLLASKGYGSYEQYAADFDNPEAALAEDVVVQRYNDGTSPVERYADARSAYTAMAEVVDALDVDALVGPAESGTLRDETKMSREASGQLSQERASEQAPQREEIE